jgi:hypothetical protein
MKWKNNLQLISLLVVIFLLGLFIGFLFHVPYFTLKSEVDVSALVSILALFAATLLVPLVINKHLANAKTHSSMLVNDIDEVVVVLSEMKNYYAEISFNNRRITNKDRGYILHTCTSIQNSLCGICDALKDHDLLLSFPLTVQIFTAEVRPAYTDYLVANGTLDDAKAMNALNAMGKLVTALKSTRYKLYTR